MAVVVIASNVKELMRKGTALQGEISWLKFRKLSLAPERTEVVVMTRRRVLSNIFFTVENTVV